MPEDYSSGDMSRIGIVEVTFEQNQSQSQIYNASSNEYVSMQDTPFNF